MLHIAYAAVGTAVGLYSIMSGTENACKKLDEYVDRNIDIMTDSPILGHSNGTVKLRCKSERRMVHAYNLLICRIMKSHFDKDYTGYENKKDWTPEELSFLFRLGTSLENWWVEGLAGQFFNGQETLDPRTVKILKGLSQKEKLLIADTQVLIQFQPK